jgi:tetratricopeptide (TPR) repeat protein
MTIQQATIAIILSGLGAFGAGSDFSLAQTRTDNQISYYQELLKRNSQNAKAYYGLGDAMIRKARETGDASYFNRAEKALKKSLEIAPHNGGVMRHLAYVFYSRHEFEAAAQHARGAVQMNPRDGDAHGVLGDALLEVGDYAEATTAYERMMELDRSLYSYSRLAGLKSARGDVAGSMSDLKTAIIVGKLTKQPTESIAWVEWQLGSDYFSQGNLAEAESYYQQALKTYPGYYRALAGLAQTCAAQQRYAEAVELYQKAIGIIPMPEYISALGDLYTKAGMLDYARKQYELVEYIGKLSALNQAMYNRELAYFYADHGVKLAEGLALAEREIEYRRDIYAHDVLAWNLYKSGRLEQARAAIEEALRLETKDAKLFYHAGMIFNQLGDKEKARHYLRRALSTNPHFHILFAERANRVLSEIENADASATASQASEGS